MDGPYTSLTIWASSCKLTPNASFDSFINLARFIHIENVFGLTILTYSGKFSFPILPCSMFDERMTNYFSGRVRYPEHENAWCQSGSGVY